MGGLDEESTMWRKFLPVDLAYRDWCFDALRDAASCRKAGDYEGARACLINARRYIGGRV